MPDVEIKGLDDFKVHMVGKLTKCGKVVTAHYNLLEVATDWTAKCRVCFSGRRAP